VNDLNLPGGGVNIRESASAKSAGIVRADPVLARSSIDIMLGIFTLGKDPGDIAPS
jgi:hypothetical protein